MYILAGFAELGGSHRGTHALVLAPDPVAADELLALLGAGGYLADACNSPDEACALLERGSHRVLIIDCRRSLDDGLALARRIRCERADVSVVLIAAQVETNAALSAIQTGVCDFMTSRFEASMLADHLLDVAQRSVDFEAKPSTRPLRLIPNPSRDTLREVLVGDCALIEQARRDAWRGLASSAPVLVQGEAGTEKLALARLFHAAGPAHDQALVVVNTARPWVRDSGGDGLPSHVPPSHVLPGHVLPSHVLPSAGRSGTLFFPEVSSLDGGWQMELVKQLSELGESSEAPELRIIAGVSQPAASSWEGSVLCRLFASLGSSVVTLPPLRERGRDVGILAEHVAEEVRLERGDAALRISRAALEALSNYGWPGNVDELRVAIQHAASLCAGSSIEVSDLPPCIALGASGPPDESGTRLRVQSLSDMELTYITRVLEAVGGNKASAARLLGVDRTTLYRKLQRHEQNAASIEPEEPPARR